MKNLDQSVLEIANKPLEDWWHLEYGVIIKKLIRQVRICANSLLELKSDQNFISKKLNELLSKSEKPGLQKKTKSSFAASIIREKGYEIRHNVFGRNKLSIAFRTISPDVIEIFYAVRSKKKNVNSTLLKHIKEGTNQLQVPNIIELKYKR
jgi:hypothetical protein